MQHCDEHKEQAGHKVRPDGCPWAPEPGDLVISTALPTRPTLVYQATIHDVAWLRPVGGGLELTVLPETLQPATPDE